MEQLHSARDLPHRRLMALLTTAIDYGLSIWKYGNDVTLLMDHDLEKAITLKLSLHVFEQLSS